MHGLIFVTWEKYLAARFHENFMNQYRVALDGVMPAPLLADRVYDDTALLAAVETASNISLVPADTLLKEYGYYFITNALTRHRCAYLLSQTNNGLELLLAMHDAHEQMGRLPDGLTPPLFKYRRSPHDPDILIVVYDSPRQLCSVLWGAIEGAAAYYGEKAQVAELKCMKRGGIVCEFAVKFFAASGSNNTLVQDERRLSQQQFADLILSILPKEEGMTLAEVQEILRTRGVSQHQQRPALILQALLHLHYAGLVATTANRPGDDFIHRRYWRVPTSG
ncbi:MAG TPA: heme NO-binding domain-containing protein [Ktedonobacteraceae bacterium]|nr:heme NO-binding domain-containing protein [Ktedonobacteraceae bacterium]